jgi:hypothetical protein
MYTRTHMRTRTHTITLRELHPHEITRARARARVGPCACIASTCTNSLLMPPLINVFYVRVHRLHMHKLKHRL